MHFQKSWHPLLRNFVLELSHNDIEQARTLFTMCGADFDTKEFHSGSILGAGTNKKITAVWAKHLGIEDTLSLEAKFSAYTQQEIGKFVHPITCMKTLFTDLKNMGIISGIATMDGKDSLESCIKDLDIYDVCSYRAGYDSGYGQKPQGGMVLGFCKEHNLEPSQVMVVGYNTHDIHMGKDAGARYTVGVLSGNSKKATYGKPIIVLKMFHSCQP